MGIFALAYSTETNKSVEYYPYLLFQAYKPLYFLMAKQINKPKYKYYPTVQNTLFKTTTSPIKPEDSIYFHI